MVGASAGGFVSSGLKEAESFHGASKIIEPPREKARLLLCLFPAVHAKLSPSPARPEMHLQGPLGGEVPGTHRQSHHAVFRAVGACSPCLTETKVPLQTVLHRTQKMCSGVIVYVYLPDVQVDKEASSTF